MSQSKRKVINLGPKAATELFKPARLEIYECLQVVGPSSIADLASRLARPADSLYYHIKKLVAIGVIEAVGEDQSDSEGPGRKGMIYALPAAKLKIDLDQRSARSRKAWSGGAAAVLRLALRDFDAALEASVVTTKGPRRNLYMQRTKVRLNTAQLKEVNTRLEELHDLLAGYAKNTKNTKGNLHAITSVVSPLREI
ncbi:MAG: DNA-binding Lrp family transcriptional regulator [Planctomycetota bacterium]